MKGDVSSSDRTAYTLAMGQLTEVLALTLIDKGMIDKEDLCAELEILASSHRDSHDPHDPLTRELLQLANSLRAGGRPKVAN